MRLGASSAPALPPDQPGKRPHIQNRSASAGEKSAPQMEPRGGGRGGGQSRREPEGREGVNERDQLAGGSELQAPSQETVLKTRLMDRYFIDI